MPYYGGQKKAPPPRSFRATRRRKIWLPLLCALPVLILLAWLSLGLEPEALTSDEILHKEKWSQAELTRAMGHVFSPQSNRNKRDEVINHLRSQLGKFPYDQQRQIRIDAMRIAAHNGLEQFRALPADRRAQMVAKMQEDADRNLAEAQRRNSEARQQLDMLKNSEEGRAFSDEVTKIMLSELTTDERREFHGLIQTWVQIMRVGN